MKKEDIRSALGRIRPREELVDKTIARMRAEKEKQERRKESFFPAFNINKAARLAGACCAMVLMIGICIIALRGNAPNGDTIAAPTLSDMVTARTSELEPATYSLFDDEGNGWILASGNSKTVIHRPGENSTPEVSGVVIMLFSVTELSAYSDTLSLDIEKTSSDIVIFADFGDKESADEFLRIFSEIPMMIRATPNDDGSWTLLDYSELTEE